MSTSTHIIDGEASESDTELEIGKSPDTSIDPKSYVVAGEAPESDDESKIQPQASMSEIDAPINIAFTQPIKSNTVIHNSLLHQKLWECNVSMRACLESFVEHTTGLAAEKLSKSDKILLNVQESMRSTNSNLILARARLKQLHSELEKCNFSSALPTVKVKQ